MSTIKIDFGEGESWSGIRQGMWMEMAANPQLSYVFRVVFVAYGMHKANGHARLTRGELGELLSKPDGNGELVPAARQRVSEAVRKAVEFGYLDPASKPICLVVPGHNVQGGKGESDAPCDRHGPKSTSRPNRDVTNLTSRSTPDVSEPTSRSSRDVTNLTSRSQRDVSRSGPFSSPSPLGDPATDGREAS